MAEVEFKYDARDGRYEILDVNARSWAWQGLGALAGVDFPHRLRQPATGEAVRPMRGRPGAAWMHASRDVVAACREMPAGALTFAAYAKDDPLPGLIDVPPVLLRLLTRRRPRPKPGRLANPARQPP
jgi:predicted ATP-grasp superfamily ATP-dependent carboligase